MIRLSPHSTILLILLIEVVGGRDDGRGAPRTTVLVRRKFKWLGESTVLAKNVKQE